MYKAAWKLFYVIVCSNALQILVPGAMQAYPNGASPHNGIDQPMPAPEPRAIRRGTEGEAKRYPLISISIYSDQVNESGQSSTASKENSDVGQYISDLQRRIRREWFPPKCSESKPVALNFKIHRGRELSNLRLSKSSALATLDLSAMKAVENAAPFRQLPQELFDAVDVNATFWRQPQTSEKVRTPRWAQ